MPFDAVDLAALRFATEDLTDALTGIAAADWGLPTPCAEWDLRGLVDHVVGGNWYTARVLAGDSSDEAMAATMTRFQGHAPSAMDAVESAQLQLDAFDAPGALDDRWSHVAGELPGRQILRLRLHDLIVHTWDIAEARRPPAALRRALAEWGLDELERPDSLVSKHVEIPPASGDPSPADDPASVYLDRFGRSGRGGRAPGDPSRG